MSETAALQVGDVVASRIQVSMYPEPGEVSFAPDTRFVVLKIERGKVFSAFRGVTILFDPSALVKVPPCPRCGRPVPESDRPPKGAKSARECMEELLRYGDHCFKCVETCAL